MIASEASSHPWSPLKLAMIVLALTAVQLVVLLMLGVQKGDSNASVRPSGVQLRVGDMSTVPPGMEWIMDPTLFVLPHPEGASGQVWMNRVELETPRTEMAVPRRRLDTEDAIAPSLSARGVADARPSTRLMAEKQSPRGFDVLEGLQLAERRSTFRLEGRIRGRVLKSVPDVPTVFADRNVDPTIIRLIVDERGSPASAVVVGRSGNAEIDNQALDIVRGLRFEPMDARMKRSVGSAYSWGRVAFDWYAEPTSKRSKEESVQ